jgi:capsular exopolysaccharide synthesis family protein
MQFVNEKNGSRPSGGELKLKDVWSVLAERRWLVLGVALSVFLLIAAYTFLQPPSYAGRTTVRIDDEDDRLSLLADLGPLAGGGGQGRIETEMLVLQSRQIAEAVVDSLKLQVELLEPRVRRDRVLLVHEAGREVQPRTVELVHAGSGVYRVRHDGPAPVTGPAAEQMRIGETARLGDLMVELSPRLAENPPERIRFRVRPFGMASAAVQNDIEVMRPNPYAQILSIRYRDTDPFLAAAVPNAAAASFIRHKSTHARSTSTGTVGFLREQVASYEEQLRSAEADLRAYREQMLIVSPRDEASEQVRRLAELRARRDELQSESEALSRLLDRVRTAPSSAEGGRSPYRQLASFPVFLSNRAVQDLLQSITQLENQRSQLLIQRTPQSIDVAGLNERIEEMELQLLHTAMSYQESLRSQLGSLDGNLARFGAMLETVPAREVEYARLLRQQALLEELYTLLQTRLKEAEIREAVVPSNVRVVDAALVPDRPVSPNPVVNLTLALILGLVLGSGAAMARAALDTKVRSREDAEQVTDGLPVLGMIPRIQLASGVAAGARWLRPTRAAAPPTDRMLAERLVTRENPRSPASEAYRALRTNITFSRAGRAPQLLVVTSAMPGDGKSTSASNLAITLARQGTRTLLVDCDLRRGHLHRAFGGRQDPGFTHVLMGHVPLEEAVQEISLDGAENPLHLLSSGVLPPNPAELLSSESMKQLLQTMRGAYETVIIDAPPINLVTDAAILGLAADATVLVARSGTTDRGALEHAVTQLRHLHVKLGGIILNDLDADHVGYYGAQSYYGVEPAGTNGRG